MGMVRRGSWSTFQDRRAPAYQQTIPPDIIVSIVCVATGLTLLAAMTCFLGRAHVTFWARAIVTAEMIIFVVFVATLVIP